MTDLTEQYQKGELPAGWYYIEGNRVEGIYAYTAEYLNNMYRPRNGERIIAKVPSYKEWQASYNCMLENEVLRLKNAQLKDLLKECRETITDYNKWVMGAEPQDSKLINKIDEVL